MKALHIHAGPRALQHMAQHGLQAQDIALVPAAAGGPKGLILNHLDRHLFGHWLPQGQHTVHLVGASIGAWRMATAAMPDPVEAFQRLAQGYIHQHIEPEPGRKMPSAKRITAGFVQTLQDFFGDDTQALLSHPHFQVHVLTSRGRHVLRRAGPWQAGLGFAGLTLGNVASRKAVGLFLERTVFSAKGPGLPLALGDLPTAHVPLNGHNFMQAMLASCSIPFMLDAVRDIPGATQGAHWDGGLVDYHFHWPFDRMAKGLVLYPHFQRQVIPGWLDKALPWRHSATAGLDNMVLLAPNPQWVKTLPGGKLPDRGDFKSLDFSQRVGHWSQAVAESERLAQEWHEWLAKGCPLSEVQPI